jgi:ABC-2 type transport system ATP-binding protein
VIIESRGLTKEYRHTIAVNRLELAVPEGSISGLLGPNGSGKTTTIKMLLGLVRSSAGEGFVFGKPIGDDSASVEIRRRTGYVSEDKRLYGYMTGKQILDFTRPLYPRWSCERERTLVEQFDLPIDRKFKRLSKGMRTKLALVLALARRPELLILDEPGEGLDPLATEQMLQAVVQAAAEGATIFFSTHQLSDVERVADHVFIMKSGRLVFQAPLEQLRENYRRIQIVFPGRPPIEEMNLAGMRKARVEGHILSLVSDTNLAGITERAEALGALSINAHPVNLREVFLDSVEEEQHDLV